MSCGHTCRLPAGAVELDPAHHPSFTTAVYVVAMANGDVYAWPEATNPAQPWEFTDLGNVFGGSVQVESKSWSGVNDGYRKQLPISPGG